MLMNDYITGAGSTAYADLCKNFAITVPEHFNFAFDVADRYANTEPQRRALVWCDDSGDDRVFTFADLKRESNKTARYLQSLGVKQGDSVLLILRRRYEFWFFLLALHKIGAIAVPATNMLLTSDLTYRNNAAGISVIVSLHDPKLQAEVDAALPASPTVHHRVTIGAPRDGWLQYNTDGMDDGDISRPAVDNDDIMLLYFTSGTAGEPKMVQHNFTYPLGHIATAKYWQNVVDGGLHLTVAETGWAKAMWGKVYGQWLAGSAVFAYDMLAFMPGKLLEKIDRYGVTTFCAPPTVYRYLAKQDLSKYHLTSLTYCTTAGEALEADVSLKFTEKTGQRIHEGYGQTETTLVIGTFVGMEIKPGSMGKPAPGYHIDIVNADGTSCAVGEEGEIVLRLDHGRPFGLFAGYYHDQALTDAAFAGNLYHTGDVAYRDDDGYFWFSGRTDDMIKSAGFRISPFEVESVLQKHPAVLECAVTGVRDDRRGQIVKATVVPVPGYEPNPALGRELQEFVKQSTAHYKYPRIIEFVDELPKTISGKIRRTVIRALDSVVHGDK